MKKTLLTTALVASLVSSASAVTPEEILPSGMDSTVDSGKHGNRNIRKGSIRAFLKTIMYLNSELKSENISPEITEEIKDLKEAIIDQDTLGTFKFFPLIDWFSDATRQGTILAGLYYLQLNPNELSTDILKQLSEINKDEINKIVLNELNIINSKEF